MQQFNNPFFFIIFTIVISATCTDHINLAEIIGVNCDLFTLTSSMLRCLFLCSAL